MVKLLLDIDGVLNPFMSTTLIEDGYCGLSIGWASWFLNPKTHGEWLKQLVDAGVDIVWCSSWLDASNGVSSFFDLPQFEHVQFEKTNPDGTWKLPGVIAFVNEVDSSAQNSEEQIFWLDDELKEDAHSWAKYRGNVNLMPCDDEKGWQFSDFERILAAAHQESNKNSSPPFSRLTSVTLSCMIEIYG